MATSADDLLRQARQSLYAATRELPESRESWRVARAAKGHYYSRAAAWPALAQAHLNLLRPELFGGLYERPSSTRETNSLEVLRRHLQSVAHGEVYQAQPGAEPDAHLLRAATLTAAAGDAMQIAHDRQFTDQAPLGTSDLALSNLDHAARITAVYAENSTFGHSRGSGWQWLRISQRAQAMMHSADPTRRSSVMGSAPVVSSDDQSLAGALDRWHRAAVDVLQPSLAPSSQWPLVAVGLAQAHSAAAAAGLGDRHRDLATTWANAVAPWRHQAGIRLPGPDHLGLRTAHQDLARALDQLVGDHRDGNLTSASAADRSELRSFLEHQAPNLAATYVAATTQMLESSQPAVAARMLARETPAPISPQLAAAARAGRWVPLPPHSAPGRALLTATAAAQPGPSNPLNEHPNAELDTQQLDLPAEAIEARAAAAHGSPQSIQQLVSRGAAVSDSSGPGMQRGRSGPAQHRDVDQDHSR